MNVVMSYEYVDILYNHIVSINYHHNFDSSMTTWLWTWLWHGGHVRSRDGHMITYLHAGRECTVHHCFQYHHLTHTVCVGCTYVQAHVSMLWYVCMCTCMCVLVKQRTSLPDSTLKSDIVYGDSHTRQLSMSLSYTMKNKITSPKSCDKIHFRKWSGNETAIYYHT